MTGGSVGAYVAQVDRILGAGQKLYAGPAAPAGIAVTQPTVAAAPLDSGLTRGVAGAADQYGQQSNGIKALDADTNATTTDGNAERHRGAAASTGVRDTARSQAAAITPATASPGGVKLLVSSMDERLAAMQRQLDTTKAQNRLFAARLRQLAGAYRMTLGTAALSSGIPLRGDSAGAPQGFGPLLTTPMSALSGLAGAEPRQPIDAEMTASFSRERRPSDAAAQAVQYAKTKLGLPYVWGAQGPRAYDCSGLVQDAYRHAGIALPRTTYDLIGVGSPVPRSEIREGDLILSNFSAPGRPEHVQLAVSPATVIEAPTPGGHVQYSSVPSGHIVVKRVA